MKKKKISMNAICFILAGVLAVAVPCVYARADSGNLSKRADSGLQSIGNVEYQSSSGSSKTVLFDITDLYYLENRIEDELKVICQ